MANNNEIEAGQTEGQQGVRQAAVKKKKKIIIVTGAQPNAAKSNAAYTGQNNTNNKGQNRRPAGASAAGKTEQKKNDKPAANQGSYHPIKPKTVPTQMSVDYHKPEQNIPRPKREEVQETVETKPAAEVQATTPAPAQAESVQTAEPIRKQAPAEETKETAAPAAEAVQAPVQEEKPKAAPAGKGAQEGRTQGDRPYNKNSQEGRQGGQGRRNGQEGRAQGDRPYNRNNQEGRAQGDRPYNRNNQEGRPQGDRPYNRNNQEGRAQGDRPYNRNNQEGRAQGDRPYNRNGQEGRAQGDRPYNRNGQEGRAQGDRPYNRNNQEGRAQGDRPYNRSGQEGRPQGDRSFNRNDRNGQDNRQSGRKSTGAGRPAEAAEAFGNDNKRRMNQAKDKRNKKDTAFATEEERERKNKSGKFIKPVVEKKEEPEEQIKVITIPEKLTIGDLADAMHMKPAEIIKKLFLAGKMMTVNSELSYDDAEEIAADYEILCEKEEKVDVIEELLREEDDSEENMVSRPPVICVMGHVDHGKTSILDYIRKTRVTEKEAGGITQAIGAYTVNVQERTITFLDTPGHEAFTAMRLRGAQSTDIAVLVVAADDGVMPQTIEAINHAKAAGVEIIVAVNKIDKPAANPDRVKEQLSKYELIPTDWGGQTEFVNVSAKTGEGIEDLLDTILLQADVMELKANPDRIARGLVLEARLDKGRGPVANVLVQKGTLHVGDFISAGAASGKVRALINDKGQNVKEAGPSTPLMVLGLSEVPSAGEVFLAHENNDSAKAYAAAYKAQHKEELVEENRMSMNMEDLFDQMREGKMKELDLIVKADVQGSVEALCASLLKLSNDEVVVKIIHSAAGNITESDVSLAQASNAAIIGFNVHPDATAKSLAEHGGVSIHLYKVIYQAIDDVDAALKGMLAPVYEEKVIGHAEVRMIFKSGKIGNIAGSYVLDGVVEKGCSVRITRDGKETVFEGALASLKRFKDDVKEVKAGYECGLVFEEFDSMNVGDIVEAYKMVEVPREQVIAQKEKEAQNKK